MDSSLPGSFVHGIFQARLLERVAIPYAKLRLTLKKLGETTRPFRYDLNQIPDDYTVEVTNKSKGLDLIDRVPEELWTEAHNIVQEAMIKTIPKKKEMQNGKMVV